jgi:hypothetical protein
VKQEKGLYKPNKSPSADQSAENVVVHLQQQIADGVLVRMMSMQGTQANDGRKFLTALMLVPMPVMASVAS